MKVGNDYLLTFSFGVVMVPLCFSEMIGGALCAKKILNLWITCCVIIDLLWVFGNLFSVA